LPGFGIKTTPGTNFHPSYWQIRIRLTAYLQQHDLKMLSASKAAATRRASAVPSILQAFMTDLHEVCLNEGSPRPTRRG
jgi:hypothetical protein